MKFLDTDNVCVKQRRAELVIDLYELMHQARGTSGVCSLSQWSQVRGHANKAAALRDLYRRKDELRLFGVILEFGTEETGFEVDLRTRGLRALVTREINEATNFLEERRKKNGGAKALSHDDATNASGTCLNCDEAYRLPIEELLSRRRHGASMKELCREFHVHHRRLTVILKAEGLEGKHGAKPVEETRELDQVDKAIVVARGKSSFKVKVSQIGELLDCSASTAARFIKRVRGGRVSSTDRRRS